MTPRLRKGEMPTLSDWRRPRAGKNLVVGFGPDNAADKEGTRKRGLFFTPSAMSSNQLAFVHVPGLVHMSPACRSGHERWDEVPPEAIRLAQRCSLLAGMRKLKPCKWIGAWENSRSPTTSHAAEPQVWWQADSPQFQFQDAAT